MYFNENKENTNIDSEFNNKKGFDFESYKKPIIIGGAIILGIILLIIIISLVSGSKKYFIILDGDQEITIYQGANYNEVGYTANDNRGNDLTSQVTIKSNLDTEAVGTYTIIYSLGKKSEKRTINVIERPSVTTVIYLNGDKNMTLKVGEEFKDPGYKAIDALDGDLTSKVKVTGTINTEEKGSYRLVYSVVNSNGVTTTEARTIIVE